MSEEKKFFRVEDLANRYSCTKRSVYRWMKLKTNPFPSPKINREGVSPLWAIEDVLAWEEVPQA